nr:MAG TPA: hypothetical protein [Caudoviricetes sp.]
MPRVEQTAIGGAIVVFDWLLPKPAILILNLLVG